MLDRDAPVGENMDTSKPTLMSYKLTTGQGFIIFVLVLALVALGERILYDLARTFATTPIDYFNNLGVILVHSFFVLPLLIVSIIVNLLVGAKKAKYAIVLIPYFAFSIVMAMQLALQVAVYFAGHHTKLQLYLVLLALVVITSYAIYYIQNRHTEEVA